jgi:hypothetical protein
MSYTPLSTDWKYDADRSHRENNWKVGILFYRQARKVGLQDLHIIVNRASSQGCYSDIHVTIEPIGGPKHHIYYQINGGELVADYVLAPQGWRDSYWINFPYLRSPVEAEALAFAKYCAGLPELGFTPGQIAPDDQGQPSWAH